MTGVISVNVKKIKMTAKVNSLIAENYREGKDAGKYDDGHRLIDTGKTKENVFLLERPADYDRLRKDRIDKVNRERAKRIDPKLHVKRARDSMDEKELRAATSREAAATRKLRADTVDTLGLVVQPSADFINALSREEQTRFFRDALEAMQARPDFFGRVETAVIHYDENTPHMQCLASAINEAALTSDTQKILGNKSKMSERQTVLASAMKAKGWDIERGIKRIDNPEYRNWKDDMEAQGYKVSRYNDAKLWKEHEAIRLGKASIREREAGLLSRESSIRERESRLDAREAALEAQEGALRQRGAELDAEREKLLKMAHTASEIQRENEAERMRLDQRSSQLDQRSSQLDGREKSITNRQQRAADELRSMAAFVRSEAAERLEAMQSRLRRVEDAQGFDEAVEGIGDASGQIAL